MEFEGGQGGAGRERVMARKKLLLEKDIGGVKWRVRVPKRASAEAIVVCHKGLKRLFWVPPFVPRVWMVVHTRRPKVPCLEVRVSAEAAQLRVLSGQYKGHQVRLTRALHRWMRGLKKRGHLWVSLHGIARPVEEVWVPKS